MNGEEDVYVAAIAWLRAQCPPLSEADAASLLALVRYPLLARGFFHDTVREEPLLRTQAACSVLFNALAAATYGGGDAALSRPD